MKTLVLCLAVFLIVFCTCGCNRDKAAILFNHDKITVDNVMNYSTVFRTNERIYYLVIIPKKIKTRAINIQVIKKDNKYMTLGYNLYWSYSAVLKDDQMYYYDDYVVISQPGLYIMKVFSKDNPQKTLCFAQFLVQE